MIKLEQISLPILFNELDIISQITRKIKIKKEDIKSFEILKLAIDARRKPNIKYVASIGVELPKSLENNFKELVFENKKEYLEFKKKTVNQNIIIVGFGPSGIFAGLSLAQMGLNPIIIEQGKMVGEREKDVLAFWKGGKLNKYSNVQFGEGGAGTFSDGKLNSNVNNKYVNIVLNEFIRFGAPKEIGYKNKPHIGSDKLKTVVKNIREHIKELGGTFMFSTKVTDFVIKDNRVTALKIVNVETNEQSEIKADKVLLCVGHSARDTFKALNQINVHIKQKPFAMGVRIEHKQKDINLAQYGKEKIDGLPNADYKLAVHLENGRSVFTFCMCPGGEVVASSSTEGEIVTNGMSNFARDLENANSAVLVNIVPEDYGSSHPLAGIEFQEKYEKLAFNEGGRNYFAPAESVGSFLNNDSSSYNINYTYRPGISITKIEKCLPEIVTESLKKGLPMLDKKLKGFANPNALLVAIESRTSCPLQIVRDESYQSNILGLYPVGEGAGYAGGIMSSAIDGIKTAMSIYENI